MRTFTLAGIALIGAGAFILLFGGNFTSRRDVLDFGGLIVTAEERHPIRPWIAAAAVLAGIGLVVAGARRETHTIRP
jgi:hypothetical protein